MKIMKTLQDCKQGNELINLGFPENLLVDDEDCERLLEHCKKHDMEFLKGSYGTIVHKSFNKHFKKTEKDYGHLADKTLKGRILDHSNLMQYNGEDEIVILASSPYMTLDESVFKDLMEYPYSAYAINPNFLDYIEFARQSYGKVRNPVSNINYAFTEATSSQMLKLNEEIHKDIGVFPTFIPLKVKEKVK